MIDKKYLDIITSIFVLSLFFVFRADYVLIFTLIILPLYMFFTGRRDRIRYLLISFLVALTWVSIAKTEYSYNMKFLSFNGISVYPLIAWTLGLFGVYIVYLNYHNKSTKSGFFKKIFQFNLFYIPLMLLGETLGYHIFKIHNMENIYSGLPVCDCLHAVWWMKIAYFVIGTVFISACILFDNYEKLFNKKRKK